MLKKILLATTITSAFAMAAPVVNAADYIIDTKGQHAFINFRVSHLGYSWVYGTFRDFSGSFTYDKANPSLDKVDVVINTKSIDTNHAKRDEHLRSNSFLDVEKFGQAKFVSTKVTPQADNKLDIEGNLTLHGVTKPVTIHASFVGEGKDAWGGYRAGFIGTTTFKLQDFDISTKDLGNVNEEVEMTLSVEGVRQ